MKDEFGDADDEFEPINEVEEKEMSFADEIIDESDTGMRQHFGKEAGDYEDDDDWADMAEDDGGNDDNDNQDKQDDDDDF